MTAAWARGDSNASMSEYRVEKDVRPLNLQEDAIRFLFPLPEESCPYFDNLQAACRSLTHLGWGIDQVAGELELLSEEQICKRRGETWIPTPDTRGSSALKVPTAGTLDALMIRHEAFLKRIGSDGFKPVPPVSRYQIRHYRRSTDPDVRQYVAFTTLEPDGSRMRLFDPLRRTRNVAGMARHALALAAAQHGWSDVDINRRVHGKTSDGSGPSTGPETPSRFQYLPLPTIQPSGRVESIRRILIVGPSHWEDQINWVRRALSGADLIDDRGQSIALLTMLPGTDGVLRQYVGESQTWSTVTPVILPGYDDPAHLRRKLKTCDDEAAQKRYLARLDARMLELIRKAFRQAGFSRELIEKSNIEWQSAGFRPGLDLASRYLPPENLGSSPRYHIRVTFPNRIAGPLAIGSGRFRGFGLFAIERPNNLERERIH